MNVGCMPTKTLVRSSEVAHLVKRAKEFGIEVGEITVNFEAVFARKQRILDYILDQEETLKKKDITWLRGWAKFIDNHTIELNGEQYRAEHFVIATGSAAIVPPIPGLKEAGFWRNEEALSPPFKPQRLICIGGGPENAELGQVYHRLGVEVTIIQHRDRLVPMEDHEVSEELKAIFEREGIQVLTSANVTQVRLDDNERVVSVEVDGRREELRADAILVATGRRPVVEGMGLENAGVAYDLKQGIRVDEYLRTTAPNIWGAGDSSGSPMLAHRAGYDAELIALNAFKGANKKADYTPLPWAIFTDPPIGHVGLTEAQAREKGYQVKTGIYRYTDIGKAIAMGEEEGFCKLVVDGATDNLLGAHIIGAHGDDIVHEAVLTMTSGSTVRLLEDLKSTHIHPTLSEIIARAAEDVPKHPES
ncbi:Mercuric reductase [compost metagenome]|jgi:pyruvate/2-oxoglutarate dehydrogenase complex dihydrolipoamide dehydrogenase (E3) component